MDYDEIDEEVCALMREHGPDGHIDGHDMLTEMVVRRVAEEVAAERERCANVCDETPYFEYDDPGAFFARLIRGLGA